jgi:hypothetical protein
MICPNCYAVVVHENGPYCENCHKPLKELPTIVHKSPGKVIEIQDFSQFLQSYASLLPGASSDQIFSTFTASCADCEEVFPPKMLSWLWTMGQFNPYASRSFYGSPETGSLLQGKCPKCGCTRMKISIK